MKVKEFIEWLKTQDQEAIVKVCDFDNGRHNYEEFNRMFHGAYIQGDGIESPAVLFIGNY